jgi:polyketide cyclase/dehydrase/lipid transport protein
VADVLSDPLDLPRWWPSVYLSAEEIARPGPGGLGQRVRLHTRGWLPYTLRWELEVLAAEYPKGFTIAASGDLEGTGVWSLALRNGQVDARFEWRVAAKKPLLRYLSGLLKPLFAANHRWAMREGRRSLEREIERRRGAS